MGGFYNLLGSILGILWTGDLGAENLLLLFSIFWSFIHIGCGSWSLFLIRTLGYSYSGRLKGGWKVKLGKLPVINSFCVRDGFWTNLVILIGKGLGLGFLPQD